METRVLGYAVPDMLVETDWLASRVEDAAVRIVDMGMPDGYARAHIPGAVHPGPDRSHWLKDPADPLHVVKAAAFRQMMEGWGVCEGMTVVAYDEDGGHQAARLWSVMRHYGHDSFRLLNGGWNKWLAEGRGVTQAVHAYSGGSFTAKGGGNLFVLVDEMKAIVGASVAHVLDVRSRGEWEGSVTRGNRRTGHMPRASHMEWSAAIADDRLKAFRPAIEIRDLLVGLGIKGDKPVVTYCQGGVRASHTAFVLQLLGYDDVRIYDGSFAEWGNLDDTPIVT